MNKVVLMGRLTKDIEVRETSSGLKVTDFTLAVDRIGKNDETDFVRCTAWRQMAEYLQRYAKKGNRVLLEGKVRVDTWEDDDDAYHEMTKITCDAVSLLDWNDTEKSGKEKSKKFKK